jgi:hypothetical protein
VLMVVLSTQGPSAQATGMDGKMDPATPLGPRVPARTRRWTLPEKPDTHVHMRYVLLGGNRDLVIGVRRVGPDILIFSLCYERSGEIPASGLSRVRRS